MKQEDPASGTCSSIGPADPGQETCATEIQVRYLNMARLAAGMADDLVTSVALASQAKVLIAPAMNNNMFTHPITQENIAKLKRVGYHFVEPIEGELVCGRVGVGHIAENDTILNQVKKILHAES